MAKCGVPSEMLQQLREKYGLLFDMSSLENQLMFIYKDQDFLKESPMEFLKYIFEMNIQGVFQKLSNWVKSYLHSKMNHNRLGCLCRISIHKDILHEKIKSNFISWF